MKYLALTIGGMTCDHCVASVRTALAALPRVTVNSITLADGRAELAIDDGGPPVSMLADALRKAGYLMLGYKSVSPPPAKP